MTDFLNYHSIGIGQLEEWGDYCGWSDGNCGYQVYHTKRGILNDTLSIRTVIVSNTNSIDVKVWNPS